MNIDVLRFAVVALTLALTFGFALMQLLKRRRVSDIADYWLYTWTGGGIFLLALEAFE